MSKDTNAKVGKILDNNFLGRFGKLGSVYVPTARHAPRFVARTVKVSGPKAKR